MYIYAYCGLYFLINRFFKYNKIKKIYLEILNNSIIRVGPFVTVSFFVNLDTL